MSAAGPLPSRGKAVTGRETWLREKGARDRLVSGFEADLWCVRGKVYDLNSFMSRHPGGREWLEMTRGHDITELVETHHVNDAKLEEVMRKYYVKDCENPKANDEFSWDKDGFYKTLKRRAVEVLKDQPHGPTIFIQIVYTFILCAWATCLLSACVTGSWPFLLAAALLLHPIVGIGHNSMHQGISAWRYCLDLTLFSHREWQVSHCISHHTYPNSFLDYEMSALEPFIYSLAAGPRNGLLFYVGLPVTLANVGGFEAMLRVGDILLGKRRLYVENLLPLGELALLLIGQGLGKGVAMWMLMHAINSFLTTMVAFPLHHSGYSYTEGMGPHAADYGVYTLQTTKDYATDLPLIPSLLFFQLFNNHSLHHLFPGIDESRLPQLEDVFRSTCADFNVPYRVHRWTDLAASMCYAWVFGRKDAPYYEISNWSTEKQ